MLGSIDAGIYAVQNVAVDFVVKVASSARRHRVSRARILQALTNQSYATTLPVAGSDPKMVFVGTDDRGIELEVVAVVLPRMLLVIHAMPTHYRRSTS